MSAALDAQSVTAPGIFVEGRAKVVSNNRIEITMTIVNRSEQLILGAIRPLYCHQYRTLTGFPQWVENFDHTFVLRDGKLTPMSEVKTAKDSDVKSGAVKGSPEKEENPFVTERGGVIEDGVDASAFASGGNLSAAGAASVPAGLSVAAGAVPPGMLHAHSSIIMARPRISTVDSERFIGISSLFMSEARRWPHP
jgi:hypothetical protein